MSYDFRLPDVGEGLHEGTLVEWLVGVGDHVMLDQPFCRVETDKAVVELPAPKAATVQQLHFDPGDTMHVGDVIITFEEDTAVSGIAAPKPVPVATPGPIVAAHTEAGQQRAHRAPATPRVRALARQLGVELSTISGTGRSGRITEADVERAAEEPKTNPQPARRSATVVIPPVTAATNFEQSALSGSLEQTDAGPVERVAVSHLRNVIAEAMSTSVKTAAHVTHMDDIDVTDLVTTYQRAKARHETNGAKFSILPYYIRAVTNALKAFPKLNATFDEERNQIVLKKYYNIGVAVDAPDGLLVPVIRNADQKSLAQLANEIADKAERARARRLSVDELRGGSFTISSLGPLGGAFATPIIHHPEMAIIGLHAIKERPAVVAGQVVPRKIQFVSISYDHRFIDGADAARFMQRVLEQLEHPGLMVE